MKDLPIAERFMGETRGRIVGLLRRGARTVEELAELVEVTDNAIRAQLTALERDGLVRQEGIRRGEGAGKPAVVFGMAPSADALFSMAYAPVLSALVESLNESLPEAQVEELMRAAGKRLAQLSGGTAAGPPDARSKAAAAILTSLGGVVDVDSADGVTSIRGHGCPLSTTVSRRPETCEAIRSMIAEVTGAPVRQSCEHGDRPRCGFQVEPGSDAR